jgi:hypothetical protein
MAKSPQEILEGWRKTIPPETPKEDVVKVVEFYFAGMFTPMAGGSHFMRITDPMLAKAHANGYPTGTINGTLVMCHHHGKTVKRVYVDNLLTAINLKAEIEAAREK